MRTSSAFSGGGCRRRKAVASTLLGLRFSRIHFPGPYWVQDGACRGTACPCRIPGGGMLQVNEDCDGVQLQHSILFSSFVSWGWIAAKPRKRYSAWKG